MLGNIVTNPNLLEDNDKRYYRECYCGLCKALQSRYKNISRFTLNYEMNFLIVLLNEFYKENNEKLECRCMMHPVNKHTYIKGKFVDYVADMNILLAYFNLLDDWQDDKNVFANCYAKLIKKSLKKICKKYPKKAENVQNSLKELNGILFGMAIMGMVGVYPDIYNIFNILREVPENATIQNNKNETYYFE